MSASKKKKLRQEAGPSNQMILEQEKAAAYKKKVRTYTIIGVVIAVLVVLLLVWNSGLFQRNQTAAVVGDTKYTVNDVNYFYQAARYNSFYIYSYLGYDFPSDDEVMNAESGQTYREYFLESSLDSLKELTALYDAAIADGYSDADVADDVKEQIESTKSYASQQGYSYKAYLKMQFGRYMTPAAYKSILTKSALVDAYYSDHSKTLEYSDEALNLYYEENKDSLDTFDFSYLYFTPGEVAASDEVAEEVVAELKATALSEAKSLAEAALAQVQSGIDIADVAENNEGATFTAHTEAVGSSLSAIYGDELKALAEGESVLVENGESGIYVITLHERKLADTKTVDVRHVLINAESATDDSAPTVDVWAAAEAKINEIQAEYLAGEQTEEAFAALAEKYSEDGGSNTKGGLYTGVTEGNFVAEFDSWLFDEEHEAGDIAIIKHVPGDDDSNIYYGYHLAYYVGDTLQWKTTAKNALTSEDLNAWVDGLSATYTAEYTSAVKHVAE